MKYSANPIHILNLKTEMFFKGLTLQHELLMKKSIKELLRMSKDPIN